MHAQQLPVKLTGIYSFNTSIISNGYYARKTQLLDCKNCFKALKTKAKTASISKINKTKIKANIAKELQCQMKNIQKPKKQQKSVKDVMKTK